MLLLKGREGFMNCLECAALDRTLKAALAKYIEARSAVFFRVSTEFAAMKQVDMERAWPAYKSTSWCAPSQPKWVHH
jgi:hypothetical protein